MRFSRRNCVGESWKSRSQVIFVQNHSPIGIKIACVRKLRHPYLENLIPSKMRVKLIGFEGIPSSFFGTRWGNERERERKSIRKVKSSFRRLSALAEMFASRTRARTYATRATVYIFARTRDDIGFCAQYTSFQASNIICRFAKEYRNKAERELSYRYNGHQKQRAGFFLIYTVDGFFHPHQCGYCARRKKI